MLRQSRTRRAAARAASAAEIARLATDAFIFGCPLVVMDLARQIATATATPNGAQAPANQFAHLRTFAAAERVHGVLPTTDSLYSIAWLDLSRQPMVLSLPEIRDRYYSLELVDAWTNVFANPGARTLGGETTEFAIIGPFWQGILPPTLGEVMAPTDVVCIIARIETSGGSDVNAVHDLQDRLLLTPLSEWGSAYLPPMREVDVSDIDLTTSPAEQVQRMDAATFFGSLNALLRRNPAAPADARALDRFAMVGIRSGARLHDVGIHPALNAGVARGRARVLEQALVPLGEVVNGWEFGPAEIGRYGTNYLLRAVLAMAGLCPTLREDLVALRATVDSEGRPLSGAHDYRITFPRGTLPPVKAFWSISLYDERRLFADNPLKRFAIGDRDNLTIEPDGSITVLVQHRPPGAERERDWLPAPAGTFSLVMRLYWPLDGILTGHWQPPLVIRRA